MYSVEEAAQKLGVSKVTVYAKLKKYKDMVVTKQGKKYIADDLFNLIYQELNHNKNINADVKAGENEAAASIENTEDKELNKMLVDALLKELDEKNKQIESLQEIIKNSQVLLKNTQGPEPLQLQEHIKELDAKLSEVAERMEARKEEQQKGLFKKLFRKKG